jgi:hypothetical protein
MCLSEQACVAIEQVGVTATIKTGIPEMTTSQGLRSPSTVIVVSCDSV